MDASVPLIDITPFREGGDAGKKAVARAVDRACRETGFFTIAGHGVPEELTARVRRLSADFFALPLDEKKRSVPQTRAPRGYSPPGSRSLAYTREGVEAPPDLQESYAVGPLAPGAAPAGANAIVAGFHAPNIWPERPAGFAATMSAYYQAMSDTADTVMRIFAVALGIPEHFFAGKFDRHPSVLRLTYYPAQGDAPLPGQIRSGEHTDYGNLTILRGDDVPGGLQVKRRDGVWADVHPDPRAFICNIGDLMMRWANDAWVSTPHRVPNPPREFGHLDRISLVFFHMPNHDATIRCVDGQGAAKYPPVQCADYFASKYLRTEAQTQKIDLKKGAAAAE
jgi:isopenicillin N synthase-like dioxygenase